MSSIAPEKPILYLNGDSLYDDANFTNQVELIEVIFGKVNPQKPAGYEPATCSDPSVYRVYSGVAHDQPDLPIAINSPNETIESANFEGLSLPSIFSVDSIPTVVDGNFVFTFTNVCNSPYNTGWDTFHFICENGVVDPKLSIKRPV